MRSPTPKTHVLRVRKAAESALLRAVAPFESRCDFVVERHRFRPRWLGLPDHVTLPGDALLSHRTPDGFVRHLPEPARARLERWLAADIALCDEIRNRPL